MASENGGSIWFGSEYCDLIDDYAKRRDNLDNRSEAARELVDIGLRETGRPLLYRFKDWASYTTFSFIMAGLFVLGVGWATPLFSLAVGAQLALLCLAFALGTLGLLEFTRTAAGQSDLADRLRGVRQ